MKPTRPIRTKADYRAALAPGPVEAIKFQMEQRGLTPRDLEPMIGRLNRVYEVLARDDLVT